MNRIYRLVFNPERGLLQVASELATSQAGGAGSGARRTRRRSRLAAAVLAVCACVGASGSAFAVNNPDFASIFDDEFVMDPDTAALYDWSRIEFWGMIVGYDDDGHVTVRDRLLVDADGVTLGYKPGVTGRMDLVGPGTTLSGGGWFYSRGIEVGYGGEGFLDILQGATATEIHRVRIGYEAGSSGIVNVDGEGSQLLAQGAVVGRYGNGTLNITNGGKVGVGNIDAAGLSLDVAAYEGSIGSILVDGTDSELEVTGNPFVVGNQGMGSLTVDNGGQITKAEGGIRVGQEAGSHGEIEVTRNGSITTATLHVGVRGDGEVWVHEGGTIQADREDRTLWMNLGAGVTELGSLLVEGPGSVVDAKGGYSRIGYQGNGELIVRDGAHVMLGGFVVGSARGATGKVSITGEGTRLSTRAEDIINVGWNGSGELEVLKGARFDAGNLAIGTTPTRNADVEDGKGNVLVSGEGSTMVVAGELVVGDDQAGSLLVENGASVEAGSFRLERDDEYNGSRVAGEVHIRDAGTQFRTSGEFYAAPHFHLTDGATLESDSGAINFTYATLHGDKAIISGTGTTWDNTGNLYVRAAADITGGATVSTGTLSMRGGGNNVETGEWLLSQLRVLGEGSRLIASEGMTLGNGSGTLPGYLVVAEGGRVESGGDIHLGSNSGLAFGTVLGHDDEGAVVIADPELPGSVNEDARIVFDANAKGDNLVFNHASDNLVLANALASEGYATGQRSVGGIRSLAGTTRLTGDMDRFADRIDVTGGKLVLDADVNVRPDDYDLDEDRRYLQVADIAGGTLIVNRDFGFDMRSSASGASYGGTSAVSAHDNGVLGGSGRIVGQVEAYDGGHIAPGDGNAATLAIDGGLAFGKTGYQDSTAFYDVDVRGNGTSDRLVVSGKAELDVSGVSTTVTVNALDPGTSYQDGRRYTILTAEGGVDGTFDRVRSKSAFLAPRLAYDPNNVFLTIAVDTSKAGIVVRDGEVLDGNNAWAGVDVQSGGTVSPGTGDDRTGTISATGPIHFAPGSFYDVDIRGTAGARAATLAATAGGDNDLLTTTATASLEGGTVRVTALDPQTSYQDGHSYTILTAEGGLEGTFDDVLSRSAFIDPSLAYDEHNVRLSIALKTGSGGNGGDDDGDGDGGGSHPTLPIFETVAATRNHYGIAHALDTLPQGGDGLALYNTLLMLGADEAREAYGSLSGEGHLATRSALLDDRFLREGIDRRLQGEAAAEEMDGVTTWVAGGASSGGIAGDGNARRTGYRQEGLMAGVDWAVSDGLVLGAALGTADHTTRVSDRASSADVDARHLGVYAQARWGDLVLRGGISHARYEVDSRRQAVVGALHADRLDASHDASATTVFAEGGWDLALGNTLLTPYLALAHTRLETDGATEEGGISALHVDASKDELLAATAGVRASWAIGGADPEDALLQAGLAWQNNSGELKPDQHARFAAGGDAFTVYGTPLARNMAVASLGLSLRTTDSSRLTLDVQGRFGDGQHDGGAQVQWNWRF